MTAVRAVSTSLGFILAAGLLLLAVAVLRG